MPAWNAHRILLAEFVVRQALGRKRGDKDNIKIDIKEVCFYDERCVERFRGCVRWSDFVMASLQSWHIESF
jgi:hypothetical protein